MPAVSSLPSAQRPWAVARLALLVARHPRAPWIIAALAFLLSLPLLTAGYLLDDNVQTWVLRGNEFPGGPRGSWDLYRFADGAEGVEGATRQGIFPWWSSPDLKLAFFRPLPSLWRAADFTLWGDSAFMPHLEASVVFALMVLAAAKAYGRIFGGVTAGVATLLFAFDDAHSMVLGWIANRYGLLAGVFALLSLALAWPRGGLAAASKEDAPRWERVLSPVCLALALLCGELASGVFGYLLALAWFHPSGRKAGFLRIAPHAGVLALYGVVYVTLGYGGGGSTFYIDPMRSPGDFAVALVERAPRLALSQLALPPSELWQMMPPGGWWGYLAVTVTLSGLMIFAILRVTKFGPVVNVLGIGALLAIIPVCATNAADRLLLIPGFGAFGVLAMFFMHVWTEGGSRARRGLAGGLAVVHLVLAPLLLPLSALNFVNTFRPFILRGLASLPKDASARTQHFVVLSTPDALLTYNMFTLRALEQEPGPLEGAIVSVQDRGTPILTRTGDRTFTLKNAEGQNFGMFTSVFRNGPLEVGARRETDVMTVTVKETRPADSALIEIEVELHFPVDQLRFLAWKGKSGFEEVTLPAPGEELTLPAVPLLEAL